MTQRSSTIKIAVSLFKSLQDKVGAPAANGVEEFVLLDQDVWWLTFLQAKINIWYQTAWKGQRSNTPSGGIAVIQAQETYNRWSFTDFDELHPLHALGSDGHHREADGSSNDAVGAGDGQFEEGGD